MLTMITPRMVATHVNTQKDKHRHDIIAKVCMQPQQKSQIKSMLQSCHPESLHSQGHSKLNVRKADYKVLYSQKADTTTFVVSKSRHYKLLQSQEADTTNFCSLKKLALQTLLQSQKADTTNFCSLKKWALQTFLVSKSWHYKLFQSQKADTATFVVSKSIHYNNSGTLKKKTLQTFVVSKS